MLLIVAMVVLDQQAQAKKKPKIQVVQIHEPDSSWILSSDINQYDQSTYSNVSIEYSGKDGFDIGVSSQNIPVSGNRSQNFEYDTFLQVSKTFKVNQFDISAGTGNGYSPSQNGKLHSISYADILYDTGSIFKIHYGIYYVNKTLSTINNHIGFVSGFIVGNDDLYIQTDYFSGHNNVSGAQSAIYYSPYPFIKAYTGVLVPEKNSGNEFAGVIGVQWVFNK